MRSHLRKDEFRFVAISVMVLEVASFLIFIFGTLGAILGTYSGISTTDFILLGFGGIFIALMLMATAELLQLVMRIEHNTRKENTLLMKGLQVEEASLRATKSVASALKKKAPVKRASAGKRTSAARSTSTKKRTVRKAAVKKVKPRKRK